MKRLLFTLMALAAASTSAQTFFPMKQGAFLEYQYSDAKGRKVRDKWHNVRWLRMTVEQVQGDTLATVRIDNEVITQLLKTEHLAPIAADLQYGDVLVRRDNVIFDNMQWLFPPVHQMLFYRNQASTATYRPNLQASTHLSQTLKAGDSLPDDRIRITFDHIVSAEEQQHIARYYEAMNDRMVMEGGKRMPTKFDLTMTASTTNRRVEGLQRVVSPAGEFECWKISYNLVGPREGVAGMPDYDMSMTRGRGGVSGAMGVSGAPQMQFSAPSVPAITPFIDYVSPTVGLVRREKLSDNGKRIVEVMELKNIIGN